jgi:signal transduction histidine kinase/DNA-binding response OmpR family regulator
MVETSRSAGRPPEGSARTHELFDPSTELGRDLAAVDWANTALGSPDTWPTSLRNVVRLMLGSRFAMWMGWGPELVFFCNDAYRRDTLGAKYPWALGRRAGEVWSEIWDDIGPRIESVIATGQATWDEDLLLFLERSGYQEETYHTFSYSPLSDDDGAIAGMLCVVSEETGRVIGERRMRIVRDLGTGLAAASTVAEVNAAAAHHLALDRTSVPFALAYLFDHDRRRAELVWTAGLTAGQPLAPAVIQIGEGGARDDAGVDAADGVWPVAGLAEGRAAVIEGLDERYPDVPKGDWPEPVRRALALPFTEPGERKPFGFLVAGLNRYRVLDADYRGFLELVAGQVAAAITRARAFEGERRRAEELAELDRAKTTFFTNVSHELRTPLTLLLGPAADALEDTVQVLPPVQRGRLEVVQRNAERLLKLVNTLLDSSRLESGEVRAQFEPLDLAAYTAELATMFEAAARRAGLTITVDCTPLPERAHVDREMWAKIVLNLLSNALKATFVGGITVRLTERDGAAELSVSDTGIGIAPEQRPRLFERFHRVVGAELRSHEGSGIGLALVAELAALHGGTVTVDSELGVGSTFTVRIPIGTEHLPAGSVVTDTVDRRAAVEQYGVGFLAEADRWLGADDADARTQASRGAGRDAPTRPRLLVVDDNADMREYVTSLLAGEYRVRVAVDGAQALELAREDPPDLVLTDVMMPRLDGFGLLAALRSDPATMHIPVVMLSARSGEEAAVLGLEAGADDYLVKPFSARELLARVRANLELDRVRRVAAELDRSRALLDQAEALAHVGSWELEVLTGRLVGSYEFLRMLGLDAADAAVLPADGGVTRVLQSLHPDDRRAVVDALKTAQDTDRPLDVEARVVAPDGAERIVRARAVLQRTSDGSAEYLRGSAQDVTEQRRAEEAIAVTAAAREAAAREHVIAEELQRSLLPASTLRAPGLEVAAYYAAGVEGTQAGGDWYDVIDLGSGRSALVIGDVMGRGVRAAAVMGQLRAAVRAYSRLELGPARLLQLLDLAVRDVDSMIVTCVYGIFDSRSGRFTYGNAGHLPPLLVRPGEPPHRLRVGDPPLGSRSYQGQVETVPMPPGSRLILYTDGLVEHRGSDLDTGMDQLAEVLSASEAPIEGLPGVFAGTLLPAEPDDDVAILAAEVVGTDRPEISCPVPSGPDAVGEVRRAVVAALTEWGLDPDVVSDVQLIVSELVTNAVRHAAGPMRCRVRLDERRLVVDVADGGTDRPQTREFDPAAPNGRGLHLVQALSSEWGVRPTGAGKSIWCVVPTAPVSP